MNQFMDSLRYIQLSEKTPVYKDKYLANGFKPIEEFTNDIVSNLIRWSVDPSGNVYYETQDYWYSFVAEDPNSEAFGIIWMRRFSKVDIECVVRDFANAISLAIIGKKWLKTQYDKRVKFCSELH